MNVRFAAAGLLLLLLLFTFGVAPARAGPSAIEYGSKLDGIGAILAQGLRDLNTPTSVAVTDDGAVWFRESLAWHPRIARFARNGTFREYREPVETRRDQSDLYLFDGFAPLVAEGNDVIVGLTREVQRRAVLLSPDGHTHYHPANNCLSAGPNIACFRSRSATIPEYPTWLVLNSIVRGPDGALWFTDTHASLIGRLGADGSTRTYTLGLKRWSSGPQLIALGPDGNLWFTEKRDRIGRITPAGHITEFSAGIPARSFIGGICAGPDGNLWFTLYHGNVLGRITTGGAVRLYDGLVYPSRGPDQNPVAMIVRDRAGLLYYNETQAGRIARVTITP